MAINLRGYWHRLQHGTPGRRFQERYERAAHQRDRQHIVLRVLKIIGALVLLAIGVIEVIFPGPAVLFFFVGGAMLATEFRFAARFLDWAELRIRSVWHRVQRRWRGNRAGRRAPRGT